MESAVRDHEAVMTGLYIDPVSGKRRLDIVAPFYVHIAGRDKLIAVAVLTRDPEIFLYPMIQMWPISSKTAETLLVRREGNSVLVLNNVRFKPDSALKMKLNFTQTNHPTVQAILGRRGIFRGVDYRGKRVVAFLTDVQDSPWLMVSKIDADEIFEGIRFRLFSFFVLIAVLLAGALISTHAMRQRVLYFKTLHEKDEAVHSYASRLKEVNKELEAFSYSVSHDIRAPLRGRDGFSKALLDDYSDKLDDTGKGYLNRVRAATKNMSELIDDMLELSRISRKDIVFKTVNLDRIADEIMAGLKEHEPERQVDFSVQAGLTAWGDAHLFEIALQNLLGNAWKFTGKQRSAKIEFGRMKFEGQDAYFIRDDGVGFDAAYYDKLFNPFQRLHSEKEFPGTGIGLVTVRRIVERHGGRVWAESKAGKGATFYFTLNEKKEAL
jgi:signal transduction histidine kinase